MVAGSSPEYQPAAATGRPGRGAADHRADAITHRDLAPSALQVAGTKDPALGPRDTDAAPLKDQRDPGRSANFVEPTSPEAREIVLLCDRANNVRATSSPGSALSCHRGPLPLLSAGAVLPGGVTIERRGRCEDCLRASRWGRQPGVSRLSPRKLAKGPLLRAARFRQSGLGGP